MAPARMDAEQGLFITLFPKGDQIIPFLDRFVLRCDIFCQGCYGLIVENLVRRQRNPSFTGLGDQLDAQNGIAAQFEKVLVDADIA